MAKIDGQLFVSRYLQMDMNSKHIPEYFSIILSLFVSQSSFSVIGRIAQMTMNVIFWFPLGFFTDLWNNYFIIVQSHQNVQKSHEFQFNNANRRTRNECFLIYNTKNRICRKMS